MLARLFFRHKIPPPRFAQGVFFGLLIIFGIIAQLKPAIGLAGLGTVAIIAAALVELNRVRIWENYHQLYKKTKGLKGVWHEPREVYYRVNIVILWPFVALLGTLCLWLAYILA
jgi:uncharacterized membrane protein